VQCASLSQAFSAPDGGKHRPKAGIIYDSSASQLRSSVPRQSCKGPDGILGSDTQLLLPMPGAGVACS